MDTPIRPCSALLFAAIGAVIACNPQDFLADFVDLPYGTPVGEVQTLEEDELESLMTTLYTRYTRYVELRAALPFETLLSDDCVASSDATGPELTFVISVSCALPDRMASGDVLLAQRVVASNPRVTELDLEYVDVSVDALRIDGTESIRETDGADGTSQRSLDMVQGGVTLVYDFRLGLLDGQQVVLDYVMNRANGDEILVRLSDPQTPGAAATVYLTGIDGTVTCELRNVPWQVDAPARGLCDNGATFGLPDGAATIAP